MNRLFWHFRSRTEILFAQPLAWFFLGVGGLIATSILAATLGAVEMSFPDLAISLFDEAQTFHGVLWNVRLPRIAGAGLVGMNLALAGLLLQTAVRNPLADPGILGVSAGAGLGALVVILFFPGHSNWIPWAAFAGGGAAMSVLLGLAVSRAPTNGTLRIVLSGVALQAILFAAISVLTFAYADRAPSFAAFIVGSLNGVGWNEIRIIALPSLIGLALSILAIRTLNLLTLDDGAAGGLGLAVQFARFAVACLAALVTAAAVSVSGLVNFVGLVVPNAMRLIVGPDHRALLPVSAVSGAALVILADTAARTVWSPLELPVGALLSLIGGPYFIFLLGRKLS